MCLLLSRRTLLALLAGVVQLPPPTNLLAKNGPGPDGRDNGDNNGVGNGNGVGNNNGNGNGVGNDNGNGNGTGNDNGNGPGNDNGVGNDDGDNGNGVGNDDGASDNGIGNDDGDVDNGIGNDDGDDNPTDDSSKEDSYSSKKQDDVEWSQDRVLKERQLGRVIPLRTALRIVNTKIVGRVIDVDLMVSSGKPQYRVKIRRADGAIRTVRLDARTGKVNRLLGF